MDYIKEQETILITGATGFIGSVLVRKIIDKYAYDQTALDNKTASELRLILVVRDKEKARSQFSDKKIKKNIVIVYVEASVENLKADVIDGEIDYVIHCASPTKSSYMISKPVETINSIVVGTGNILELAKNHNVKSMVYLSSMEVYGNIDCQNDRRVSEEELGDIDVFNVRSCYPMGKRMAENLCYSYYKEYNVPVKIARLSQTFGSGVPVGESRIFAQFADAVCSGNDIVLHTSGDSVGNYCDIEDTVEAVFLLLQSGQNGEAYNIVNERNTMTIRQMAELVAEKVANGKIAVVYDIPNENLYGYAAATGVRLSSKKIEKLGWKPKTDLLNMYRNMIRDMELRANLGEGL